jgi:hypothetical protein
MMHSGVYRIWQVHISSMLGALQAVIVDDRDRLQGVDSDDDSVIVIDDTPSPPPDLKDATPEVKLDACTSARR